jgi:hypothetical protein
VRSTRQLDSDRRAAPAWKPELVGSDWSSLKVAQLRYEPKTARWSLFYRDSNERGGPTTASAQPPESIRF